MDVNGILVSSIFFMFAFSGFESVTNMKNKIENPEKSISFALNSSIIITGILYLLTCLGVLHKINAENITADLKLTSVFDDSLQTKNIISMIAICSIVMTILLSIFSRVESLEETEKINNYTSLTILSILTICFIYMFDLKNGAYISTIIVVILYLFINIASFMKTRKEKKTIDIRSLIASIMNIVMIITIFLRKDITNKI